MPDEAPVTMAIVLSSFATASKSSRYRSVISAVFRGLPSHAVTGTALYMMAIIIAWII